MTAVDERARAELKKTAAAVARLTEICRERGEIIAYLSQISTEHEEAIRALERRAGITKGRIK